MKKFIIFAIISLFCSCSGSNQYESMEVKPIKTIPHIQNQETAMEVIPIKTVPKSDEVKE